MDVHYAVLIYMNGEKMTVTTVRIVSHFRVLSKSIFFVEVQFQIFGQGFDLLLIFVFRPAPWSFVYAY